MADEISIAIETSCRAGGLALGAGDELMAAVGFSAAQRHATQLITRLKALLSGAHLRPQDVHQVYVSAGPGSFTGLRIGITTARTLAEMIPALRCVAVPTAQAVAANARDLEWEHLGVLLAAKATQVHVSLFARSEGQIVPLKQPCLMEIDEFLRQAPRPLLVIGEAAGCYELTDRAGEGVRIGRPDLHLPTAEGLWRTGRAMAARGRFTEYSRLLPVYPRGPEAVRLWEARQAQGENQGPGA